MEEVIQFQRKAEVVNEKGESIGSLERVVMDPDTKIITDLVISGGSFFKKDEKVVPMDLVAATASDVVVLRGARNGIEDFPEFEETRVLSEGNGDSHEQSTTIYGHGGTPILIPDSRERLTTFVEQNIPEGTVALKEGAKVIGAEGKQVGQLECVFADPDIAQVTHLLVSSGLLTKETNLVPIHWVATVMEDEVHLGVKKDYIDDLANVEAA